MTDFLKLIATVGWVSVLPLPVVLAEAHWNDALTPRQRAMWRVLTVSLVVAGLGLLGSIVARNVIAPPDWDFYSYWIFGQAVARGLDPYDPANLATAGQALEMTEEFRGELFYLHSPPTLLLFAPLGWLGLHSGALVWQLFHVGAMALDIYLLWRLFWPGGDGWELALVAMLTLTMRSTMETAHFTQVNFLLLTMLLLYWSGRKRWASGVWLTLGIAIKPVLAVFLLMVVIYRQGRAAIAAGVTALVLCGITAAAFGPQIFASYLAANPLVLKVPKYFYFEPINQSLLATILRLTGDDLTVNSPYANPWFWGIALGLLLVTGLVVSRCRNRYEDWGYAITIAFGLLVFPKTLSHYAVLLLPAILVIWRERECLPGRIWTAIALITVVYGFIGAKQAFVGIALTWLTLAVGGDWQAGMLLRRPANRMPDEREMDCSAASGT